MYVYIYTVMYVRSEGDLEYVDKVYIPAARGGHQGLSGQRHAVL